MRMNENNIKIIIDYTIYSILFLVVVTSICDIYYE